MGLHNTLRSFGTKIIGLGSLLVLLGCSPEITKHEDLTGDGIPDLMIEEKFAGAGQTYLFIGKKDGTFVRSTLIQGEYILNDIPYFKTLEGEIYIFDGKFYRHFPKK
jgi:hypothetical protein